MVILSNRMRSVINPVFFRMYFILRCNYKGVLEKQRHCYGYTVIIDATHHKIINNTNVIRLLLVANIVSIVLNCYQTINQHPAVLRIDLAQQQSYFSNKIILQCPMLNCDACVWAVILRRVFIPSKNKQYTWKLIIE